jgi:hypothetical protein
VLPAATGIDTYLYIKFKGRNSMKNKIVLAAVVAGLGLAAAAQAGTVCNSVGVNSTGGCNAGPAVPNYRKISQATVSTAGGTYTTINPGASQAQVVSNFPSMYLNIINQNPYTNTQFTNMSDEDLAEVTHMFYVANGSNEAPLIQAWSAKLSAANLVRLAAAVSPTWLAGYTTAPPAVWAAYLKLAPKPMIPMSQWAYTSMGYTYPSMNGQSNGVTPANAGSTTFPAVARRAAAARVMPEVDAPYTPKPLATMSMTQIFEEFYAAGTGTTKTQATLMAIEWATGPVGKALGLGTLIGRGAYMAGEWAAPGIWEDLMENMFSYFGQPLYTPYPKGSACVEQDGTCLTVGVYTSGSDVESEYQDCGPDGCSLG